MRMLVAGCSVILGLLAAPEWARQMGPEARGGVANPPVVTRSPEGWSREVPVTPRDSPLGRLTPYASSSNQPLAPQLSQGPRALCGGPSSYARRGQAAVSSGIKRSAKIVPAC